MIWLSGPAKRFRKSSLRGASLVDLPSALIGVKRFGITSEPTEPGLGPLENGIEVDIIAISGESLIATDGAALLGASNEGYWWQRRILKFSIYRLSFTRVLPALWPSTPSHRRNCSAPTRRQVTKRLVWKRHDEHIWICMVLLTGRIVNRVGCTTRLPARRRKKNDGKRHIRLEYQLQVINVRPKTRR